LIRLFSFVFIRRRHMTDYDRPENPQRRSFMICSTNLAVLGVSGALSGYGLYNTRHLPDVVRVSIPIRGLPDALEGFRIIQISDLHISPTMKTGYVQSIVDQVNDLHPDVIAFTGDLADGPVSFFRNEATPLKDLSANYGSYFVTGNHEYYAGVRSWLEEVDRLGFTVLLNSHRIIKRGSGSILLAGVTDYNAGRFNASHTSDPNRAIYGAPESNVKILLAHQPRSIFASAKAGFDLQISGHTHGGQIYPWQFLVYLQQPYLAGLNLHEETWVYVSRGTGYWGPPLRLGAPSEIAVITLTNPVRTRLEGA
jgi:predicted MPP superfamily phosphohydrolase